MQTLKIVIGRCVHNGEPIICTGLCNTESCPFPWWMAIGLPSDPEAHITKDAPDLGWVCGECEFTNLEVDTVCQLCFNARPKRVI
jgi:hypothetical protein